MSISMSTAVQEQYPVRILTCISSQKLYQTQHKNDFRERISVNISLWRNHVQYLDYLRISSKDLVLVLRLHNKAQQQQGSLNERNCVTRATIYRKVYNDVKEVNFTKLLKKESVFNICMDCQMMLSQESQHFSNQIVIYNIELCLSDVFYCFRRE